jgi:hypothetical protein
MPMKFHPADIACDWRSRGRQAARGRALHSSAALLRFHRDRAVWPIH